MKPQQILRAFRELEAVLARAGIKAEVGVVGGAAMVLAFNAREATRDVDEIFAPAARVHAAAAEVASLLDLPVDWLNDAAKGYMPADTEP